MGQWCKTEKGMIQIGYKEGICNDEGYGALRNVSEGSCGCLVTGNAQCWMGSDQPGLMKGVLVHGKVLDQIIFKCFFKQDIL